MAFQYYYSVMTIVIIVGAFTLSQAQVAVYSCVVELYQRQEPLNIAVEEAGEPCVM